MATRCRVTTACGRTNHSPQSEERSSERLGIGVPHEASDLPGVGGRTGTASSLSPTHKGSIFLPHSPIHRSFGAVPLRPTATMRRTSHEVPFAGYRCRIASVVSRRYVFPLRHHVGTHDLCVRCVKAIRVPFTSPCRDAREYLAGGRPLYQNDTCPLYVAM